MANTINSYVMRIKQLLCLEEAVRYGSISEAAKQNGIKQPNLSSQIKTLEQITQRKLIFRHPKGVSLTDIGYEYYSTACEIKNLISSTENISLESSRMFGNIKLWTSDGLASIYLAKCFKEFYEKYPKINLEISCSLEMPKLQEFDMALVFQKPKVKSLVIIDEHSLNFTLCASKEYINRYGMPQSLADLRSNHKICNNATYIAGWKDWKTVSQKAQHTTTVTNSSSMLLNLIKAGIGIGLLPREVKNMEPELVEIKNIAPELQAKFYLIVKQEGLQNPKIKALTNIINHETSKE